MSSSLIVMHMHVLVMVMSTTVSHAQQSANAARRRLHAEAENAREEKLNLALSEEALRDGAVGLLDARTEILRFSRAHRDQPAVGPVLLGAAGLLSAQARVGTTLRWEVERVALLNGGDELVPRFIRLLGTVGLAEAPQRGREDHQVLGFVVRQHYTSAELHALAAVLTRVAAKQPVGKRPCGRIEPTGGSWRQRTFESWRSWIFAVGLAWRVRVLP